MADMTFAEKNLFEKLLDMSGGYVLQFSNRTLAEFFADTVGIDIYDEKYGQGGSSKANHLRAFWKLNDNHLVGRAMSEMMNVIIDDGTNPERTALKEKCNHIVDRLLGGAKVEDMDALAVTGEERVFQMLAASVRKSCDEGQPEAALDRLHTYVVKYMRQACEDRGITVTEDVALHGLMGQYVKVLRVKGAIESEMADQILRNSISIMEKFNFVRNRKSLAHDNTLLGKSESLLIVSHVVSTLRFIQTVERKKA